MPRRGGKQRRPLGDPLLVPESAVLLVEQGSIPAMAQTRDPIPATALGTFVLASSPSSSLPSTRLVSHADRLAYERVSRSSEARTRVRVLDATGSFEARGSDVTLQGIRRAAAPGEGGRAGSDLVSWSEVYRVEVRGSAVEEGARIGGTTLGLIGVGILVAVSTSGWSDPSAKEVFAVTLGFTTTGAVLGGMIGALTPKWKTVHTWAGF